MERYKVSVVGREDGYSHKIAEFLDSVGGFETEEHFVDGMAFDPYEESQIGKILKISSEIINFAPHGLIVGWCTEDHPIMSAQNEFVYAPHIVRYTDVLGCALFLASTHPKAKIKGAIVLDPVKINITNIPDIIIKAINKKRVS